MVISLAGFLSAFSQNYTHLVFLRGLVGFGLGSSSVPFDLLAEFLPSRYRGLFLIYIEYFWTIGSVIVAGSSWLILPRYNWRVLTLITALPVAVSCVGSIPLLPESPRWLLAKGKIREAEAVVVTAAATNGFEISGLDFKCRMSTNEDNLEPQGTILRSLLFSWTNIKKFGPLCLIWCCFGMSYYSTILFTGMVTETSADDDVNSNDAPKCSFSYPSMFYSSLSELIGCTLVALVIEKWGRVRSQAALYATGVVGAIGMGIVASSGRHQPLFVMFSGIARLGVFSASACTWVHTPELFHTDVRATGHAVTNALSQIGAAVGPFIVYSFKGYFDIGLVIAAANALCCVCVLCLPETVGTITNTISVLMNVT